MQRVTWRPPQGPLGGGQTQVAPMMPILLALTTAAAPTACARRAFWIRWARALPGKCFGRALDQLAYLCAGSSSRGILDSSCNKGRGMPQLPSSWNPPENDPGGPHCLPEVLLRCWLRVPDRFCAADDEVCWGSVCCQEEAGNLEFVCCRNDGVEQHMIW